MRISSGYVLVDDNSVVPLTEAPQDTGVIYALNTQRHPERPSGPAADRWMSDDLWALLKKCWAWNPEERPTMAEVASRLKVIEAATRRR